MPTLHWLTRDADLQAAGRVPYRRLEPVAAVWLLTPENLL